MVVSLVAEQQLVEWLGDLISAQEIVHVANTIFLQDQVLYLTPSSYRTFYYTSHHLPARP